MGMARALYIIDYEWYGSRIYEERLIVYKPLPNGITIKESNVQGLGVFATKDFEADVILGIVHVLNKNFPHGAIRTALGAFYNHSDEPNCKNVKGFWHQLPVKYLMTVKPIKAGEELTAKYSLYDDFNENN
jgi:hypothetical protein|tara:strand:- start:153 stop:545 length:393 start_codon:yes stop_codon:yes gene_type:complete